MATESGVRRVVWPLVIALMIGTAVFVPIRIIYKQNQTVETKPGNVVISNFAFAPETLTVPAGTKVTFKNADGTVHTATASDQSFDSGKLDQGQSYSATIKKSVDYFCDIHQYMTASIKVSG